MDELPAVRSLCAGARPGPVANAPQFFFSESAGGSSPYVLRVGEHSVAFVHRGTDAVERSFVFPDPIIHAVCADFPARSDHNKAKTRADDTSRRPHLCVLVRSDCVNIYAPTGDVYEVALPFQANRLFPMADADGNGLGLLLQRTPVPLLLSTPAKKPNAATTRTTGNSSGYSDHRYVPTSTSTHKAGEVDGGINMPLFARPRFFTLSHPLDEIKPIAIATMTRPRGRDSTKEEMPLFLSDPGLTVVSLLRELSVLVAFHEDDQKFYVFQLKKRQNRSQRAMVPPKVRLVDGPAWTKFRQEMEFQEQRIVIEPEWTVQELWRSPSVSSLTPDKNKFGLLLRADEPWRSAFISCDSDGSPLLCLMDKVSGVLLLEHVSLHENALTGQISVTINSNDVVDRDQFARFIHCRDAVPISSPTQTKWSEERESLGDRIDQRDIIVLKMDGTVVLYRSDRPLCRIDLSWGETSLSKSPISSLKPSSLITAEDGFAYEILFEEASNLTSACRWEHPLRMTMSPLVDRAMSVLDYVLAPIASSTMKVAICCRAQAKEGRQRGDIAFSDVGWGAFVDLLLEIAGDQGMSSSTSEYSTTGATSSLSSFDLLCRGDFHKRYQYENDVLLSSLTLPSPVLPRHEETITNELSAGQKTVLLDRVDEIFAALHLLHEDLKLSQSSTQWRLELSGLLSRMSMGLGLVQFSDYYSLDSCIYNRPDLTEEQPASPTAVRSADFIWLTENVPDIFAWIQERIVWSRGDANRVDHGFPMLPMKSQPQVSSLQRQFPLQRTRAVCRIYEMLFPVDSDNDAALEWGSIMSLLARELHRSSFSLEDLPVGIAHPIAQAIQYVKEDPPPSIGEDVCALIGRPDLIGRGAMNAATSATVTAEGGTTRFQHQQIDENASATEETIQETSDGLDEVITTSQPIFPRDQRVKEVARLLRSSRPICLKLEKGPDVTDQDYVQQQQARLLLLCKRAMSLSVARGMVTLGNFDVNRVQTQAWRLRVPNLPLAGRTPPTNAIVSLDVSGYAKELTYWPQFHNGCATGLRLPSNNLSQLINRHWIKYHRPTVVTASSPVQQRRGHNRQHLPTTETKKQNLEEEYAAHAGLLLGIGLRGHLKCLSMADVYNYLSLSNEYVTVAILLGMATTAAFSRQQRSRESKTSVGHRQDGQSIPEPAPSIAAVPTDDQDVEPDAEFDDAAFVSPHESRRSSFSPGKPAVIGGMGVELTLERSVSKMLCLHVPSLLPAPFAEFSVPASTQTAALLGLGILYQGTGYRLMAELLLAEVARSPSSAQFVGNSGNNNSGLSTSSFDQLEGYSLAAGLALGLVLLGRGRATTGDPGLADLNLEERLHKYIVGGSQQRRDTSAAGSSLYRGRRWTGFGNSGGTNGSNSNRSGSRAGSTDTPRSGGSESKYANADLSSSEMEHVNIGVTAPGSALALAFMYLQSGNKGVAGLLAVPDTLILLDYVRPDVLLVRTLARNLVLWDDIMPTTEWIESVQLPAQLLQAYSRLGRSVPSDNDNKDEESQLPAHTDLRSICEAYANIVAGACFSIGLRFAGTADAAARGTLRHYALHFRELRTKATSMTVMLQTGENNMAAAATERPTIERCLCMCALALAMVDAGTGQVETLALLRSLNLRQRVDTETSYGSHMMLSMALGLLFLGGGRATLSRSKDAVAALVVSLFPMAPLNTADNKYHLQAFRHLYVLAVDTSRLVETVDAATHASCSVSLRVELMSSSGEGSGVGRVLDLRSPCLVPELATIRRLAITTPEYYPVHISLTPNADDTGVGITANAVRASLLREKSVILLKRRKQKDDMVKARREGINLEEELGMLSPDMDDRLMHWMQVYMAPRETVSVDEPRERWWSSHLRPGQLIWLRENASQLLPLHLNTLLALFRLLHGSQHLVTSTDVSNLRLFTDLLTNSRAQWLRQDAGGVNGEWWLHQTDLGLRRLWRHSGLCITSLSSARSLLLHQPTPTSTSPSQSPIDVERREVLLRCLVRYFAGPAWRTLSIDWKSRLEAVLTVCSSVNSAASSSKAKQFDLEGFLTAHALSSEEKTFWLQLVSFFVYAAS